MKRRIGLVLVVFVFVSLTFISTVGAAVNFQGLGILPGGSSSEAFDVSADGSVIVGWNNTASGGEAFRWTSSGGMVGLGTVPGASNSQAKGVSADGSVVVGEVGTPSGTKAFRWTSGGGMVELSDIGSHIRVSGLSADGLAVVGIHWPRMRSAAYRWTATGGKVGLGDLPPFANERQSWAEDVSADGSVVVGASFSAASGGEFGHEAYRWTDLNGNGLVDPDEKLDNHPEFGLGDLPGGYFSSHAYGVSADGSVVVGLSSSGSGQEAFRWTSGGGMVGLGDLPGGYFESYATGVSADGLTVLGSGTTVFGQEPFIWDATNGIRNLRDVLVNDFGLDLTGWWLSRAEAISADSLTIAGWGTNPSGQREAWVATIPEPATLLLFGLGGLALRRRRRA